MIIELKKRVETNRRGEVVKTVVSGVMCDWRAVSHVPEGCSVIASLDGLCGDFTAGTKVRVTIERVA